MKIFNVCFANTAEDCSFSVRAENEKEAAEFYVDAWLRQEMSWIDQDEIVESGVVAIQSITIDNGGKGLMSYDEPEVPGFALIELEAWEISQRDDYREGEGVEAYRARIESPTPGF
ncbi:hypothetical protein [Paracoccus sp. ME4]|uniref:hypothetical protein n=1 Tax=Paracoccus sp. ME4 TaxID=3138066 RepID=UPI00398A55B1